jgi:tetratricopeptide (TPR) repeat protein
MPELRPDMQNNFLKMILLAEAFYSLGNELQELGQLERAVDNYRRALEINPDFAEAHNNLGNALRDFGQLDDAVASYRRALEIKPDCAEVHFNLGNVLQDLGQLEGAVACYRRALEIKPGYADAHTNLGNAWRDLGQLDDAVASYRRALEIKPDFVIAQCNLGNVLLDRGDLKAAETHFNTALSLNSELAQAHQGLACIFQRRGNDETARYHRDRGFGKQPLSTMAYRGQGEPVQLLVLGSALEGNLPWQFLIDSKVFQTTLMAVEYFDEQLPLPPHQIILNAIGDADICQHGLAIAGRLIARTKAPIANHPAAVLQTGRLMNARRLGVISGVVTPRMALVSKVDCGSGKTLEILKNEGLAFPLLLRPPGFHRGNYFVCVASPAALNLAVAELPGENLLAIELLDSRSADHLFRKYRVLSINGSLYPIHMAISAEWKVHYFSSGMDEYESYRHEEDAFLNGFATFFGPDITSALEKISQTLGLDYCGMDFGIDKNGNILLYEANSTMLINQLSNEKQWDYRRAAIANALAASKRMLVERAKLDVVGCACAPSQDDASQRVRKRTLPG